MMVEKEDLGLSLSLSFPQKSHSVQNNKLNILQSSFIPSLSTTATSSSPSSGFNVNLHQKPSWNEAFPSSTGLDHQKLLSLSFRFQICMDFFN